MSGCTKRSQQLCKRATTDRCLQGCNTWRVGGTEEVDGYWRPFRPCVGRRAYKSYLLHNLLRAVRIHHGPTSVARVPAFFIELGAMVRAARERVEAAQPPLRQHLRLRRISAGTPPDEAETDAASMFQLFPTMALLQRPAAFAHSRPDFPRERP